MKTVRTSHLSNRILAAVSASLMLAGIINSEAAVRTWTGGGNPDFNWSNPANWGGTAPVANDILVFNGTVGLVNTNDLTAAQNYAAISFAAGAGAFRIEGNGVKMSVGCTNNSPNLQTFNIQAQNNTTVHYWTTGGDIQNINKIWDWRWYKHGPGTLICASTNTVSGLNGQVLGIDGGLMIFNAQPGAGVIGQGLAINTNGTVRVVGPSTNQIADSRDIYMTGGTFQLQTTNAAGLPADEGVATLKGTNVLAVVENGSALGPIGLILGTGGNDYRGSFAGVIRDGGAGALQLQVRRRANQVLAGASTYSGQTIITNYTGAGYTRLIVDGSHIGGGAYAAQGTAAGNFAALGGKGIISASAVNISTNGVLSPGGVLSLTATNQDVNTAVFSDSPAILTFSNAVTLGDASSVLELQLDNSTTPGSGHDQVAIEGAGSFINNSAALNLSLGIGYTPVAGDKFTIVKVQGTSAANNVGQFTTLNGLPTGLTQGAVISIGGAQFKISYRAEGSTFDMGAGNGNDIMLEALASTSANLTWRGNGTDNNWDVFTTADWWNGTSLVTFTNLDNVTFDNTGSNNLPLNLVGDVNPNKFTINASKDFTLSGSGKLTGSLLLTKTNTGRFTITTDNDFVGGVNVNQGILQIGDDGYTGYLPGVVKVNTNGVLEHKRADTQGLPSLSGAGVLLHSGSGTLMVTNNFSTFSGVVSNTAGIFQLGDGSTAGNIASVPAMITVASGTTLRHNYYGNGNVTVANSLRGNGNASYEYSAGNAQTILFAASANNTNFTGISTVKTYTRMEVSTAAATPGGAIIVESAGGSANGSYYTHVSNYTNQNAISIAGIGPASPVDTPRGKGALRLGNAWAGSVTLTADATIGASAGSGTILGNISDGGNNFTLEYFGGTILVGPTTGVNSYGQTLISEDRIGSANASGLTTIRALNANAFSSSPVKMVGQARLELNGFNLALANLIDESTLSGVSNFAPVIANGSSSAAAVLSVGSDGNSQTFNGTFVNGSTQPLGLTKVGGGILTLTGDSTNTGPVTVAVGTLALAAASGTYPNGDLVIGSGSFSNATAIAVATGATLDMSGRIDGTLTLNANQTLKHSGASVGPINVTGNVTVGSGTVLLALNRANSPATNDSLVVSGTLTAGGTLTVTNLGPVLQAGNSFQLFSTGVSGFAYNLQTVDVANNVSYIWNNTISADGKITLASVSPLVNTNSTNIVASVSGGNLTLSWPTDHIGWTLQSQTNTLSVGLGTNWVNVAGSSSTNQVIIPINSANGSVFFRLKY